MKSVLVTGASGFIGRATCQILASRGWTVRGSHRSEQSRHRLPAEAEPVQIASICEFTDWSAALEGVDCVVHLAGRAHVMRETERHPLAAFRRVNTQGTERLARVAAQRHVRRLVYVSTIKVNGDSTQNRAFSEADPPKPADAYAVSKWEAEVALARVAAETDLEVVVLRPPLVYGPGVSGNFLRLLRLARTAWPLPFGSINNRRSMIYVDNLADAIALSADHSRAVGHTFLVSDTPDVSTPYLFRQLATEMGASCALFGAPRGMLRAVAACMGKGSEMDRLLDSLVIDSSKFSSTLDWKPPCSLPQGLRETVQWYADFCDGSIPVQAAI